MTTEEKINGLEHLLRKCPDVITALDAARLIHVSKNAIHAAINEGKLTAYSYRGKRLISKVDFSDELMAFMNAALMKCGEGKHIGYIPKSEYNDGYPFAVVDEDDDEDALVVIARSDYDSLIEDILTLAELVTMVTEMRTRDLKSIKELSKFIPAFAAFERNRISVYKDARFEADEIIDRLDDMEEPYEYFSD